MRSLKSLALAIFIGFFASTAWASGPEHTEDHSETKEEKFNPTPLIMHHVMDAHEWHVMDWNDKAITVPLPVILWTENGLTMFMSSEFHHDDHGHHVVEKNGGRFVKSHEHIYYASDSHNSEGSYLELDADHNVLNQAPMDFSITKNVASLFITVLLILLIILPAAKGYKKSLVPKGRAGFIEPIVIYLRDEVIKPNIGEKRYSRFVPYLLTLFFFVWVGNMLGLVPFFPGGANLTGNIAFTMVLAAFSLIIIVANGNRHYWEHIVWMPGVPVFVKPILALVEILGIFTKPFALMIRLFANMTAGHIVILSLISLIFIFETPVMSLASVPLTLFIFIIKVFVALLQAYIFVLLTALFIGQAVAEPEHH